MRAKTELTRRILKLILADQTCNWVSIDVGCSTAHVARTASNHGFRRMYVTDDERRQIMKARQMRVAA